MITVLSGQNEYAVREALQDLRSSFSDEVEQYDGGGMSVEGLLDVTRGGTLFASKRLVIIRELSENKPIWNELDTHLARVDSDTHLVLVESKLDKRAKAYKWLQSNARMQLFDDWTNRDESIAVNWATAQANQRNIALSKQEALHIVRRSGGKQWQVAAAIDKVALLETVSIDAINQVVEPHIEENVFELLSAALESNYTQVHAVIAGLEKTDDPYRVFALLSSQVVQLSTLAVSGKSASEVASDMGVSPFVLNKLARHAVSVSHAQVQSLLQKMATADIQMKSSTTPPWRIVESVLLSLAESHQ